MVFGFNNSANQPEPPAHPENTAAAEHLTGITRIAEAWQALATVWNVYSHHGQSVERRAMAVQQLAAYLAEVTREFDASIARVATTELRLASIRRAEERDGG